MLYYPSKTESVVELCQWSIKNVKFSNGTESRHAVGVLSYDGSGRVCSPIVSFDHERMEAITRSGKCYRLIGNSGGSMNGDYVFNAWRELNGATDVCDVSHEYMEKGGDDDKKTRKE